MEIRRVRIDDVFGWILSQRVPDNDVGREVEELYNRRQRGEDWNNMFEAELSLLAQRLKILLGIKISG